MRAYFQFYTIIIQTLYCKTMIIFLQSMNLELYNKMTAYHQQVNQAAQALHGDKKSNQLQGE